MPQIVEPLLEMSDIQGNIIPGFNKPHQVLLGLKIVDFLAAKGWIKFITPEIATAEEVYQFKKVRQLMIERRGSPSVDLAVVWISIAFSAQGLRKLIGPAEVEQFEDEAFKIDLHGGRSTHIGDSPDADDMEGSPKNWVVGGTPDMAPDIFLIITGDDPLQLEDKVNWIKKSLEQIPPSADRLAASSGVEKIYEEQGNDLPGNLSGHEHFGFKDGISQPGIRGRISDTSQEFLTPRHIDPQHPLAGRFSRPGQPLVWPGQFIFGYEFQDDQVPTGIGRTKLSPSWARNGSFLVFRRLRQDVKRFRDFVYGQAKELATQPGFSDMTGERLASLLVGRWPSGAPVMRTPDIDNEEISQGFANNHFNFDQPSQRIPLTPDSGQPGDNFALAPADREGFICPHASHIRKVNPRDLTTEQGNDVDVLQRLILRRGIPFGAVLGDSDTDPLNGNRGLLFLSYQTSITDQFEFLNRNWMNEIDAPEENPGGHDLIVGQNNKSGQNHVRRCTLRHKLNGEFFEATIEVPGAWVIPTGGGYFFTPSISALKNVLGV